MTKNFEDEARRLVRWADDPQRFSEGGIGPGEQEAVDFARELLRIRKALETWRDEWKMANDPDAYWDAYDTIARIDAILAPDTKETTK